MDPNYLALKPLTRFDRILITPIESLQKMVDVNADPDNKLTEEEKSLFNYEDFWYDYIMAQFHSIEGTYERSTLPTGFTSWKDVFFRLRYGEASKKIERIQDLPELKNWKILPADIRQMIAMKLAPNEIIQFCKENNWDTLCMNENSELWKELYHRDVSEFPPNFDELIAVHYIDAAKSTINRINFFKPDSIFSDNIHNATHPNTEILSASYKNIYELISNKSYISGTEKILVLSLGAEKRFPLMGIDPNDPNEYNNIDYLIRNNHRHLEEKFIKPTLFMKDYLLEDLLIRGYFDMAKYLYKKHPEIYNQHEIVSGHLFQINVYYVSTAPKESFIFKFIVSEILDKKHLTDLLNKILSDKYSVINFDNLNAFFDSQVFDIHDRNDFIISKYEKDDIQVFHWLLEKGFPYNKNILEEIQLKFLYKLKKAENKRDTIKIAKYVQLNYLINEYI